MPFLRNQLSVYAHRHTQQVTLLNPEHEWAVEVIPRREPLNLIFTGTNRYVDPVNGLDSNDGLSIETAKKTIYATHQTCANGDIVNLAEGTYLTSLEYTGYLMVRKDGVNVKFVGMGERDNTIISCATQSTFMIRIREVGYLQFENLQIHTNVDVYNVQNEFSFTNDKIVFKNVHFKTEGVGTRSNFYQINPIDVEKYTEVNFVNCKFTTHSLCNNFKVENLGVNTVLLLQGCDFSDTLCQYSINYGNVNTSNNKGSLFVYNCYSTQSNNIFVFAGTDTVLPTYFPKLVDVRGCYLNSNEATHRGIFLGRGVTKAIVYNNVVNYNVLTETTIPCVLKSTATELNDVIVEGNYFKGGTPVYIKGGKNNLVNKNSLINNLETSTSLYIVSPFEEATVVAEGNVITNNTIIALTTCMEGGATTPNPLTLNTLDNNRYYCPKFYLHGYLWTDKAAFWGANTNDANSRFYKRSQSIAVPMQAEQ